MTGSEPREGDVFDFDRIRRLMELMKEYDLRELDLKQEDQQIRLCRNVEEAAPRYVTHTPAPPPLPTTAASAPLSTAAAAETSEQNAVFIKSPMIGTFYSRPNPNSEPFVKVGDHVEADKTVCIIEAMKVFNEIPAEVRGRIVAILVDEGEPVDFGKPLFKVDPGK